jgi:hypothetical protein
MSDTWVPKPRPFAVWSVEGVPGSIRRITEDGRLRITENAIIRITFRSSFAWINEPSPFTPWTQE